MAIRVPGEFHEDKMRQHQAGPLQAKPSQAKPGKARSSRRHGNDTEGQNDYHLGKYYPRYAYAFGNYFVSIAY